MLDLNLQQKENVMSDVYRVVEEQEPVGTDENGETRYEPRWYVVGPNGFKKGPFSSSEAAGKRDKLNAEHRARLRPRSPSPM